MDSPTERMPIACVHCAKAKAKCDKKVPCSRCVSKQIVCLSRATRRSSHNPNRRSNLPRAHSERALHTSTAFHVSQLSHFSAPGTTQDMPVLSPTHISPHAAHQHQQQQQHHHHHHHQHRHSVSDIPHQVPIAPAIFGPELDPQMLRNGYSQTPPDVTLPLTPMITNMPHMGPFLPMGGTPYDPEGDNRFLNMGNVHASMMDFGDGMMTSYLSSPSILHESHDMIMMNPDGVMHAANHMEMMGGHGSTRFSSRIDLESPPHHVPHRLRPGPSPASSSSVSGMQEPDVVLALHPSWPYFQCQRAEKFASTPPKTASIYLEGLAQTLRHQATWHAWTAQIDERLLDISFERKISTEPIVGWSREKLLAITQGFLHKALDIHKVGQGSKDDIPTSPESTHETFLMLPPPEVMQFFLRSYVVRYEPYYCSIPGGRLDPNSLMHSSNSKAASLLILLMVASGASATATPEGRYVTSGLTEACRVSLFDTVEKDVSQAREILVLRSALLLICLAAWSGDKWHMDMAMGQRGLYLAMLAHAGMLDVSESRIDINECKLDPEIAWGDWKEHEGRHRLAHSWVIVDQEISLMSDATPQLSIVDMHVPMPDSDDLWHASSATEWLALFEKIHGSTYQSPGSVRDFFTRFVDGDLAGKELSPTQLRLLLHPLQAQVCQLRQFIACLPDGGTHARSSRAVSKVATKARLEEISTLLQQWYAISRQSFSGNQGTCWTTCANLIMYHLISLNTITSFKCIEQFARREVGQGQTRHSTWLQSKCIDEPEEALFHCGQILRLIRSMPKAVRPPWWAGAIYRVAIVGWATSMSRGGGPFLNEKRGNEGVGKFAIDDLTPESEQITRFVKHQEGEPMLTNHDGTLSAIHIPSNVLQVCVDVLEDDSSMRLADGIKRKLRTFMENWKDL